jgi:hypothetical protein
VTGDDFAGGIGGKGRFDGVLGRLFVWLGVLRLESEVNNGRGGVDAE